MSPNYWIGTEHQARAVRASRGFALREKRRCLRGSKRDFGCSLTTLRDLLDPLWFSPRLGNAAAQLIRQLLDKFRILSSVSQVVHLIGIGLVIVQLPAGLSVYSPLRQPVAIGT